MSKLEKLEISISKGEGSSFDVYKLTNSNSDKTPPVLFGKNCKNYKEIVSYVSEVHTKKINLDDITLTHKDIEDIRKALGKKDYIIDFL